MKRPPTLNWAVRRFQKNRSKNQGGNLNDFAIYFENLTPHCVSLVWRLTPRNEDQRRWIRKSVNTVEK